MIDADAVLFPAGEVDPADFPHRTENQLLDDIEEWITQAYGLPRVVALADDLQDGAAKLYAEYRAFKSLCVKVSHSAASATLVDQGSVKFDKDQRDRVCGLVDSKWAAFEEATVPAEQIYSGSSVRHNFEF